MLVVICIEFVFFKKYNVSFNFFFVVKVLLFGDFWLGDMCGFNLFMRYMNDFFDILKFLF